jgi:hypothetical protein
LIACCIKQFVEVMQLNVKKQQCFLFKSVLKSSLPIG